MAVSLILSHFAICSKYINIVCTVCYLCYIYIYIYYKRLMKSFLTRMWLPTRIKWKKIHGFQFRLLIMCFVRIYQMCSFIYYYMSIIIIIFRCIQLYSGECGVWSLINFLLNPFPCQRMPPSISWPKRDGKAYYNIV